MFHTTSELNYEDESLVTDRVVEAFELFNSTYNYEEVYTYMYHEAEYYDEFINSNTNYGTVNYPYQFNFDKINWEISSEQLYHNYSEDMFALPSLRYVLDEFLNPRNIYVSGYVAHIDLNSNKVFYYDVVQNMINYHINKTIDANELLKDCKKFKETDTPPSKIFENRLVQNFTYDYLNHTSEYDYISLFEILIDNI